LPESRGTLLGALTGLVVAAAGSGGPSGISRRVAVIAAASSLVLTVLAFATGNRPILAALAMAAVALLTSLAAAAGPLGAVLGFLGSLAYFLVATMARVANLFELVSLRWAAARRLGLGGAPPDRHRPGLRAGSLATYMLWPRDDEAEAPVPVPT
jgi:hypothetical protein